MGLFATSTCRPPSKTSTTHRPSKRSSSSPPLLVPSPLATVRGLGSPAARVPVKQPVPCSEDDDTESVSSSCCSTSLPSSSYVKKRDKPVTSSSPSPLHARPAWDSSQKDPERYRLSLKEQARRKAILQSPHNVLLRRRREEEEGREEGKARGLRMSSTDRMGVFSMSASAIGERGARPVVLNCSTGSSRSPSSSFFFRSLQEGLGGGEGGGEVKRTITGEGPRKSFSSSFSKALAAVKQGKGKGNSSSTTSRCGSSSSNSSSTNDKGRKKQARIFSSSASAILASSPSSSLPPFPSRKHHSGSSSMNTAHSDAIDSSLEAEIAAFERRLQLEVQQQQQQRKQRNGSGLPPSSSSTSFPSRPPSSSSSVRFSSSSSGPAETKSRKSSPSLRSPPSSSTSSSTPSPPTRSQPPPPPSQARRRPTSAPATAPVSAPPSPPPSSSVSFSPTPQDVVAFLGALQACDSSFSSSSSSSLLSSSLLSFILTSAEEQTLISSFHPNSPSIPPSLLLALATRLVNRLTALQHGKQQLEKRVARLEEAERQGGREGGKKGVMRPFASSVDMGRMRGGGGRQEQQQQQQQQQRLASMAIPALAGHQKDWKMRKAGKEEERAVLGLESATIRKVSMGKTVGSSGSSSSKSSSKSNRAVGKKDDRKEKGRGSRKDGKGVNGVDAEEREVQREMMKSFFLHSTSDGHDNAYLLSPPSAAAAAAADGSQEFSYDEEIELEEEKDEGEEGEGEEREEKENKPRAKPPSSSSSFSKVHAPVTQLGKWATPGSWRQLRPQALGQRESKGRGKTSV